MAHELPTMAVKVQGKLYPVETYADASEMVMAALAKYHGYFRDLPRIDLLNGKGQRCGYISTNGKVWLDRRGPAVCVWPMQAAA